MSGPALTIRVSMNIDMLKRGMVALSGLPQKLCPSMRPWNSTVPGLDTLISPLAKLPAEDCAHVAASPSTASISRNSGGLSSVSLRLAWKQGLTLVSLSAQLEHLRVYKRDELSGYGYTTA